MHRAPARNLAWLSATCIALALSSGCGVGTAALVGSGSDSGGGSTSAFAVVHVTPTSPADPGSTIEVRFNKPVLPASVSVSTFDVRLRELDRRVAGSFSIVGGVVRFVPEQRLTMLGTYDVGIGGGLSSIDGEVLEPSFSSTFTVRDGVWDAAPTEVGPGGVFDIAITGPDDALAVTLQSLNWGTVQSNVLFVRSFSFQLGWHEATLPLLFDVFSPLAVSRRSLVRDAAGECALAVTYKGTVAGTMGVQARALAPGDTTWGPVDTLANPNHAIDGELDIATTGDTTYAVWASTDGVWMSSRQSGQWWLAPARISTSGLSARFPRVAAGGDGSLIVVWAEYATPTLPTLWYQRLAPGTTGFGRPRLLHDPGANLGEVELAMDAAGNALLVWTSDDVYSHAYDAATDTWPFLGDITEPFACSEAPTRLELAMNARGQALAAWQCAPSHEVGAALFDPFGKTWGFGEVISQGVLAFEPEVAIDELGHGTVAFGQSWSPGLLQYRVRRFDGHRWLDATSLGGTCDRLLKFAAWPDGCVIATAIRPDNCSNTFGSTYSTVSSTFR